jgi:hypothetical protein
MVFSSILGSSQHWDRWCSRRFLESVLWGAILAWSLSLPKWGLMQMGYPCLLRCPTAYGCQPDALSLWFGKVLPCLVAKPSFRGVAALTGPQATTIRLGRRALGPMLPGLITPCGVVLSLHHPYPVAWKLLRRLALPQWRRFECPRGIMSFMRVEGENPLSLDLKGFGVRCLGTFWAEDAQCLLLHPVGWGTAWCGSFRAWWPQPSLNTWEALELHVVQLAPKFSSF